jgi:hypothetical protein
MGFPFILTNMFSFVILLKFYQVVGIPLNTTVQQCVTNSWYLYTSCLYFVPPANTEFVEFRASTSMQAVA